MTYGTIITAETLQQHLDDPDWAVFDCRFSLTDPGAGKTAYEKGHIPGSRFMDMDSDLSSPPGTADGRHPLPDAQIFVEKLRNRGVNSHSQVVVYDDDKGQFAARAWWTMQWLGHREVALLEGGLRGWCGAGYSLSTGEPHCNRGDFTGTPDPDMVIKIQEVEEVLKQNSVSLLDARSPARYRGEDEKTDTYGGHIPGSLSFFWENNLDENDHFLPSEALRQRFATVADKEIIHSCGSGVTACHNVLAMEIAGFPRPRLYVGSWSEWSRSGDRARATGSEPGEL